eukprot:CAMPEP_0168480688 /NCGR_PEP_ID=MMETSP0228-20121227/64122_1 /TAXON_ID=133427 /ORGANISM="Protoceratium reticulatum, Strain CCCM 535 (=CCMP 1889)" /LENGTH=33 /DNA_ID= /DNA_START= /DNA_END= /DNA_ORIENTATION=
MPQPCDSPMKGSAQRAPSCIPPGMCPLKASMDM